MTEAPRISVVLAVRDDPQGLARAAASVLSQECAGLELVIVDDGSADATVEELARLAATDSRVRPMRQEARGLTAALTIGCAAARGDYIARQDAGDRSLPTRFARQAEALDRYSGVVLVSCWTDCVGPKGEFLYRQRSPGGAGGPFPMYGVSRPLRPAHGPGSHGSAMFRASAYRECGGYREQFALGQDWDLWQRLGLLGGFFEVGEALYERVQDPGSLSFACADLQVEFGRLSLEAAGCRAEGRSEAEVLAAAAALSDRFRRERQARARRGRALGLYHLGEVLRRAGNPDGRRYLSLAVRTRPTLLRAWIRLFQALFFRWSRPSRPATGSEAGAGR